MTRQIFEPSKSEPSCGPSTTKDMYIFNIGTGSFVADTVDVDSLITIWKSAKVVKKK